MERNKRKFETNGGDEPSLKIQKTGDNDILAPCKDELNEHSLHNINILNSSGNNNVIDDSNNIFA